jgi:hypothetical protein
MEVKIAVTKLLFAVVILAWLAESEENHADRSAFFASIGLRGAIIIRPAAEYRHRRLI